MTLVKNHWPWDSRNPNDSSQEEVIMRIETPHWVHGKQPHGTLAIYKHPFQILKNRLEELGGSGEP